MRFTNVLGDHLNHTNSTLAQRFIKSLLVSMLCVPVLALAFSELNEAQTWVYDTPHLANTTAGQNISYRYESRLGGQDPISDSVNLSITKDYADGRRDVSIEFLSAERRLPFPDFEAFKGNPVVIATLEHIAQNLSVQSGGGVVYFRNRIRDGLAGVVEISPGSSKHDNTDIATTTLTFKPFQDDPRVGQQPEYSNATFSVTFSEAVPGNLVAVSVESSAAGEFFFSQGIRIE